MVLKDVISNSFSTSTVLVSGVQVLYRCLLEGNGLGIRYAIKAIVCFVLFSPQKSSNQLARKQSLDIFSHILFSEESLQFCFQLLFSLKQHCN